jgi:hypothetical protein
MDMDDMDMPARGGADTAGTAGSGTGPWLLVEGVRCAFVFVFVFVFEFPFPFTFASCGAGGAGRGMRGGPNGPGGRGLRGARLGGVGGRERGPCVAIGSWVYWAEKMGPTV